MSDMFVKLIFGNITGRAPDG